MESLKLAIGPETLVSFASGQIRLLDLEAIKASLGDRWIRLAPQVHMVVETVLRRVMSPADLFVQVDEGEYLIAFPHASEQEASAVTSMAAEQIRQKLFGQNPAFKGMRVGAKVQTLTLSSEDASADLGSALVGAARSQAGASDTTPAQAPRVAASMAGAPASGGKTAPAAPDAEAALAATLDALTRPAAGKSAEWSVQQRSPGLSAPKPGFATGAHASIPIGSGDAPRGSPAKATAASSAPQGAPATLLKLPEITGVELVFRPVWDPSRQAVNACHLMVLVTADGAQMPLADFTAANDLPKVIAAVNSLVLRRLAAAMQGLAARKMLVFFPVSRAFLETETGLRTLLDQLQTVPEGARAYLVPEITDAYFGSWPALAPIIAVIRRISRAVCVRLSLDHKDLAAVAATGAALVSGHLADHDWPERQALSAMNTFAELAAAASLKTVVEGLDTSSLVIAAMSAGVNLLCGAAIGDGESAPPAPRTLSVDEFYLNRFAARPD